MAKFIYIAGPCVIESAEMVLGTAQALKEITAKFNVEFYFKASFDKANRTSLASFRGPGLTEGLKILAEVKAKTGLRVMSDIHEASQAAPAAALDVIQIPAFLCRQTDLLVAAGKTGRIVNIKKAQFLAPEDMKYAVEKVRSTGNDKVWLTERGTTFGYHNLVVDFRSFTQLREFGCPVIFDATHSVQIPGKGGHSGGERQYVAPLARAAAAYGIDGLFTEVHPDPDRAKSDAANQLALDKVETLLEEVTRHHSART